MLALGLSNFGPTVRFGLLMAASLGVALIGDLILLPCLLYMRPKSRRQRQIKQATSKVSLVAVSETAELTTESAIADYDEQDLPGECLATIETLQGLIDEELDESKRVISEDALPSGDDSSQPETDVKKPHFTGQTAPKNRRKIDPRKR